MIDPWTIFWMIVGLIFIWSIRGLIIIALLALFSFMVGFIGAGCAFVFWCFCKLFEK